MIIKPYLIVPKLIPQPTWGGTYIASYKSLDMSVFGELLVGQSYELATDSSLSTISRSSQLPLEIGNASDGSTQEVMGDKTTVFSLQSLIDQGPNEILGKRVAEMHQNRMKVLIKFTQAKGNSFQVHVRPGAPVGSWLPKPESWYFLEKGKITLGLKTSQKVEEYAKVCKEIEARATDVSQKVMQSILSVTDARKELADFIWTHSPYAFVNELCTEPETVVDLSEGGIHHSWEEGSEIVNGNIVYEVQLNVMDKDCTLRSFDKGKIADDGSIRPIHVDEYMKALDTDPVKNDPKTHIHLPMMHSEIGVSVAPLFDTLHYKSSLISFSKELRNSITTTQIEESFHHLFVKEGNIELQTKNGTLNVNKGASVFIPANTLEYTLRSTGTALIIKTWA